MQAVLERFGPRLRELHHPPAKGLLKERPPSWRFGEVLALLHQRGLLQELQVPQTSAIVGDARCARSYLASLSLTPSLRLTLTPALSLSLNPNPSPNP